MQTELHMSSREALFMQLYKRCFPAVAQYVSKMGGSLEQAKDVFQDALLVYYEKSNNGSLGIETNETAYIYGIARHLWLKRYKAGSREQLFDDNMDVADEAAGQPSNHKLMRYLATAGKKCMELLKAFYYEQQSLDHIAAGFGFSGTRSATVQKFKCLEKVRDKIKEKALTYEDFLE